MSDSIKILIVDGNVIYRKMLSDALSTVSEMEVVGVAATGKIALSRLAVIPADMILLDTGLDKDELKHTLRAMQQDYPDVELVPLTDSKKQVAGMAIRLLENGALDLLTKPPLNAGDRELAEFRSRFEGIMRVCRGRRNAKMAQRLVGAHVIGNTIKSQPVVLDVSPTPAETIPAEELPSAPAKSRQPQKPIRAVILGVSTGGPNALAEVIPRLGEDLGVPVLLVQHMPAHFTQALAASLAKKSGLVVKEAENGETVLPNHVYIAPGGRHMLINKAENSINGETPVIELNRDAPVNSCRPAADLLFKSAGDFYKGNVLIVVMTGMGSDGTAGASHVKQLGGYVLSQSLDSCVVYGMPRSVDEAGLSDEQVHLNDLADRIVSLVKG